MKLKIRIQRPLLAPARQRPVIEAARPATVERTFRATLSDCAEDWVVQRSSPTPRPPAARRAEPERFEPARSRSHRSNFNHKSKQRESNQLKYGGAKSVKPKSAASSSLAKAFTWLQSRYALSAVKRLRVSETVSLGEKRFVAIIKVEGREFLIGGGPQGVSLLTTLEASAQGETSASTSDAFNAKTVGNLDSTLDLDRDLAGDVE